MCEYCQRSIVTEGKSIHYCIERKKVGRKTISIRREYVAHYDGVYFNEYPHYLAAETALDGYVYDLCERGLVDTVPVCTTCGNDGDCPDCDPSPVADEMAYQMLARATVLLNDCNRVITMALGQSHGAASVVAELRRVKDDIEAAFA